MQITQIGLLSAIALCIIVGAVNYYGLEAEVISGGNKTPSKSNAIKGKAGNVLCSPKWYQLVESQVMTSDKQGHGPDLGSSDGDLSLSLS